MSAAHAGDRTAVTAPVLYVCFELSWGTWKLAFTSGSAQAPRIRNITARTRQCMSV
jgi:hypothetical protein